MTSLIFGPLNGLFLLISLALLVVKVWAVVDAACRPPAAFVAADKQTKVFWVVVLAIAVVIPGFGIFGLAALVAAIVYLVDVRPAVRGLRGGRGSGGW